MLRIATIIGARPQFIKAAILSRLIREEYAGNITEFLVHTGQHYDYNMSEVFFRDMMIPEPDINLGIGSTTHGRQTGLMLEGIEKVLLDNGPDYVMVYGDTNSTLAGALAAAKLTVPVIHVEAGLRSFDRTMPEEINRVLTDHLASSLFCPTERAVQNLADEGIREGVELAGDIMYDASLFYRDLARNRNANTILHREGIDGRFYLLTLHRAENTDNPERLGSIVDAINDLDEFRAVFPVHPRTAAALQKNGLELRSHIHRMGPIGFFDMLELEGACEFVVTDSGGVQKEAFFSGKPCITLRDRTEWVETVESGWNTITGADSGRIVKAFGSIKSPSERPDFYGTGDAGRRILKAIEKEEMRCRR